MRIENSEYEFEVIEMVVIHHLYQSLALLIMMEVYQLNQHKQVGKLKPKVNVVVVAVAEAVAVVVGVEPDVVVVVVDHVIPSQSHHSHSHRILSQILFLEQRNYWIQN